MLTDKWQHLTDINVRMAAMTTASLVIREDAKERALLALGLLRLSTRRGRPADPISPSLIDDAFEREVAASPDALVIRSEVLSKPFATPPALPIAPAPPCTDYRITLVARQFHLDDGIYSERLKLSCVAQPDFIEVDWVGNIPTALLPIIRSHPTLLDAAGISLGERELRQETGRAFTPDIFDVIGSDPFMALAVLTTAARHPEAQWSDVWATLASHQEVLSLLNTMRALASPGESFRDTVVSRPAAAKRPDIPPDAAQLIGGSPEPIVTATIVGADEFKAQVSKYEEAVATSVSARYARWMADTLRPMVSKLPDEVSDNIPLYCPDGHSICGVSPHSKPNALKQAYQRQIAGLDADAAKLPQYVGFYVSGPDCENRDRLDNIYLYIRDDFSAALGEYSYRRDVNNMLVPCRVVTQFALKDKDNDALSRLLRQAMRADPEFFPHHRVDIGNGTVGAKDRLAAALGSVATRHERGAAAARIIRTAGLSPLAFHNVLELFDSWYPTLRPALSTSDDSLGIALQSRIVERAMRYAVPQELPPSGAADRKLYTPLRDAYVALDAKAAADAAAQVAAAKTSIDKQLNDFQIAFSVTFGLPVPVFALSLRFGDVGFGISTLSDQSVVIIGSYRGVDLPIAVNLSTAPPWTGPATTSSVETAGVARTEAIAAREPVRLLASETHHQGQTGSLAIDWRSMPPISPRAGEFDRDNAATREWLKNLISIAWTRLSPEEVARVDAGLRATTFPAELVDLLTVRFGEAVEEERIAGREFFYTAMVPELVPAKRAGAGCPVSGCVDTSDKAAVQAYLDDLNKNGSAAFQEVWSKESRDAGGARFWDDDFPAVELTYGNDFTVMRFEYKFALKDGSVVSTYHYMQTPFNLIDRVRANPRGHEFEKWSVAAAESLRDFGAEGPSKLVLERSLSGPFLDAQEQIAAIHKAVDPNVEALAKEFQQGVADFWQKYAVWAPAQRAAVGAGQPFVPPDLGSPMLNFFAPPFEWFERRNQLVDEVLLYQRIMPVYGRLHNEDARLLAPNN